MITIRYADLPEGLHAQAEQRGRRTVIYLRPGLTAEQRRLVLRRARQSARMGYGPRLPAAGVAQAVARDSIRGTLGTMGAVLRRHPVGSIVLAAGLAAVVSSYALFVTGSIRLVLYTSPPPALSEGPYPAVAHLPSGPLSGPGGYRAPTLPGSAPPRADPLDRHGEVLTPRTSVTEPGPVGRQQPTGATPVTLPASSVSIAQAKRTVPYGWASRCLTVTGTAARPVTCTGGGCKAHAAPEIGPSADAVLGALRRTSMMAGGGLRPASPDPATPPHC